MGTKASRQPSWKLLSSAVITVFMKVLTLVVKGEQPPDVCQKDCCGLVIAVNECCRLHHDISCVHFQRVGDTDTLYVAEEAAVRSERQHQRNQNPHVRVQVGVWPEVVGEPLSGD